MLLLSENRLRVRQVSKVAGEVSTYRQQGNSHRKQVHRKDRGTGTGTGKGTERRMTNELMTSQRLGGLNWDWD